MRVLKRDNIYEDLSIDKIGDRLRNFANDIKHGVLDIDTDVIVKEVVSNIYDGITTYELDEESARIAISHSENLDFLKLASRIVVNNLHKSTSDCFMETMRVLYDNKDGDGNPMPIIADDIYEFIKVNKDVINKELDYSRDYLFDYFGFKTLEKSYLLHIYKKNIKIIVERPQHLYMRVAIAIHHKDNDLENLFKTYNLISQHFYTHASPTLFNAGLRLNSYASCFLLGTHDSIDGIYKTLGDCAKISKVGGGIGVHISNVRAKGSVIRKTNGISNGIIPMIKVYNNTCLYVNQSGRRKGSFALYIEPWHADIMDFLDLKKNQGHEDIRARDLFYAIWAPDLFMKQVKENGEWYLMCPDESPGLTDVYGDEFEELYWKHVKNGKYRKIVKAQDVWEKIIDSLTETGVPYISFKDSVNRKNNQKNLGTIKSSNLCNEINLYSDDKNYAVCFTGDTLVNVKDGFKRIDECMDEDVFSLFSNDTNLQYLKDYTKSTLINNGTKEVYTLRCEGNRTIKATLNHPFLTYDEKVYKWKQLEELSKKDNLVFYENNTEYYLNFISITFFGNEVVYDLNVPSTHNFVANGFVVHNCNLASIALPKFVEYDDDNKPFFNFDKLMELSKYIITPMNNIIDNTYYPTPETNKTNLENRPLGIGIQGLADVYYKMKYPYESQMASELNIKIHEAIYYGCLRGSIDQSIKHGKYSSFENSPYSKGLLQFDLAEIYDGININKYISDKWDWKSLKSDMIKYGSRNSMMTALMPTASTSQIMNNTESFEFDSNIYKRNVLSGEYLVVNKYLIKDLSDIGLWSPELKDKIIIHNGSIQEINEIPKDIKNLYKTIWEISMKKYIEQARDRQVFVDQSCSMNLFQENPTRGKLTSMLFYSWECKLKTGVYYLRSKNKSSASKFSIDASLELNTLKNTKEKKWICNNDEECVMCSS